MHCIHHFLCTDHVCLWVFFLSWSPGCTSSSSPHLLLVTTGEITFNQGLELAKSWLITAVEPMGPSERKQTTQP